MPYKTIRLKVKGESKGWLQKSSVEVNQVWNFCNERSSSIFANIGKRLSGYELCRETGGSTKYLPHINSSTMQRVCVEYAARRKQSRRVKLRWRVSRGPRRSLGWVPFKGSAIAKRGRGIRYAGKTFRVFEDHQLDNIKLGQGCFAEDSVGDWWLCVSVEVLATNIPAPRHAVGIDLGLKSTATTSDAEQLSAGRYYRESEARISQALRRGHKKQAKRLHRKAKRQRNDALHKFSRKIVNQYQNIVIGDVSSSRLVKTRMAKNEASCEP